MILTESMDPSVLAAVWILSVAAHSIWDVVIRPSILRKKPFETLPMPPGNTVVLGHIPTILQSTDPGFSQVMRDAADERGRTGFWLRRQPTISLTYWEDARAVLQAESTRLAPRGQRKHVGKVAGKNSILLLNGREWKIHRAAVS